MLGKGIFHLGENMFFFTQNKIAFSSRVRERKKENWIKPFVIGFPWSNQVFIKARYPFFIRVSVIFLINLVKSYIFSS